MADDWLFDSVEHEKVIAVDQNARIDDGAKIRLLEAKLSHDLEACAALELDEDGDIVIQDRNIRISSTQEGENIFVGAEASANTQDSVVGGYNDAVGRHHIFRG